MSRTYPYQLRATTPKVACPLCKFKTFRPYTNRGGKVIDETLYGRCDRESKCGYHKYPVINRRERVANAIERTKIHVTNSKTTNQGCFIDWNIYKPLIVHSGEPLPKFFDIIRCSDKLKRHMVKTYSIGFTIGVDRLPYILFPYIDHKRRITAVQAKGFDSRNKTIKPSNYDPIGGNKWLHTIRPDLFSKEFLADYKEQVPKVRAAFGEHAVSKRATIIVHESVKNALYYTAHLEPYKCHQAKANIAVGSKSMLRTFIEKHRGQRNIILIPDPDAYDDWNRYSTEHSNSQYRIAVHKVPNTYGELDVADYLHTKWHGIESLRPKKHQASSRKTYYSEVRTDKVVCLPINQLDQRSKELIALGTPYRKVIKDLDNCKTI